MWSPKHHRPTTTVTAPPPSLRPILDPTGDIRIDHDEVKGGTHLLRGYNRLNLFDLSPDHLVWLRLKPVRNGPFQIWYLRHEAGDIFREYYRPGRSGSTSASGHRYRIDADTIGVRSDDGEPGEPITLTRLASNPRNVIVYQLIPIGINVTINYFPASAPAAARLAG